MNTSLNRSCPPAASAFLLIVLLALGAGTGQASLTHGVRADFQNPTPTNASPKEPGVIFFSGHLVGPNTAPADVPTGGGRVLQESSFGQPFSPFVVRSSTNSPSQSYGDEVAAAILARLYPPPNASKGVVEASTNAFRYKNLLFAPNTTNGVTRTVADFDGINSLYGATERRSIQQEITNLVTALAVSPLHTGLRTALLNAYTDRAVAEMQFNKQDLVSLGKKRLALELVGEFVINEEITLLSNIVARLDTILNQYASLLSRPMEGVEPRDFDTRAIPGTPFGYYIFQTEQPARNASAPQYFDTNGTLVFVPDFHPVLKELPRAASAEDFTDTDNSGFYDAGEPFVDANTNGIYDAGSTLFNGFKDYTTVLKVMAEYVKRSAELARFYGMRRAPGDFAEARRIITGLQRDTATDFAVIRGMYAGVTFPAGDASGVNAAIGAVERAFGNSVNVRTFLQGRGNILGLDGNFMVFLQDGSGVTDTYDQLKTLVFAGSGTPLTDALLVQTNARVEYENFRASVDLVVKELNDVEDEYKERFEEITGYLAAEIEQFDGTQPKPNTPSELATLDRNLDSLGRRQKTLGDISKQFVTDLTGGTNAINQAEGIGGAIQDAENRYLGITSGAFDEIKNMAIASAAAQATSDAAIAAAASPNITAGIFTGVAGAINASVQTVAAAKTANREKQIDAAAIALESKLAQVELPLAIQQTRLELGAIIREQYANLLEMEDNNHTIAQTIADRTRLLREVEIIQQNFDDNQASIRSRFYADPIHLVRSDNAIIKADAAFANAQRWMFYLQRALEYKWNQNFVGSFADRDYDSGSIFKMRNAEELKDLYSALENFNSSGRINFSQNADQFTVISLRNLLVPNPRVLNTSNTSEPGVRVDIASGQVLTQTELFRRKLSRMTNSTGDIEIPLNTTLLNEIDYPSFNVGPRYNNAGQTTRAGRWHDVVRYIKVNIVNPTQAGSINQGQVSGTVRYSGMSLFRTRVAPNGLPDQRLNTPSDARDIPGELISTPFRSYVSLDTTIPVFVIQTFKDEDHVFKVSTNTVQNLPPLQTGADHPSDHLDPGAKFNAFTEYSVAATGWKLTLYDHPNLDVDQIDDIEFIVGHRSAVRSEADPAP